MNYFNYKQGRIHYYDKGKGAVIVLLHGYLESADVWCGIAEKLSSKFRIITIDLPGHGSSDIYGETHTMEFMATIVKELLDSLGITSAFLTGHSLGGYVTLAFLEYFPDYLNGYSLFHSHPLPDPASAIEKRHREISIVKRGKKNLMYPDNVTQMFATSNLEKFSEALQKLKNIASGISGEGIIAVLNGMIIRPSRVSLMEEGKVPCLWILGLMDNYIPCEIIQSKVSLPDNAEIVVLQKSGHIGFIEEENKSVTVISDFVEKLDNQHI